MENLEERSLRFVLHFYEENKLDTAKALKAFKVKHQIADRKHKVSYLKWLIPGMVAATLIGFLFYPRHNPAVRWTTVSAGPYPVDYVLPDRSAITLYPHSDIRFREGQEWHSCRKVLMRGKVRFEVVHDESCPFVVEGRMAEVRVVGTQFVVDESHTDTAIVNVEAGKVQFAAIGQSDKILLTRGMTAQLTPHQHIPKIVGHPDTGSFVFDNAPLDKVLDELSQYYKVKLHAKKTNKRLTASLKEKRLDEIIRFIEKVLDVKIEKQKQ